MTSAVSSSNSSYAGAVDTANKSSDLTCVIAAHNAETTLRATIESVVSQSMYCQIIVVDDGSTDQTAMIASGFGSQVILLSQANAGPGAARNKGIEACKTTWIALLDADDIWLPGHLCQWHSAKLRNPEGSVFYSGAILTDRHRRIIGHQRGHVIVDSPFLDLLFSNWLPTSSAFFRRDDYHRLGGFSVEHRHAEDWDFWLRLASLSGNWILLQDTLVEYRQIEGSLSRNFDAMWSGINWALDRAVKLPMGNPRDLIRRAKVGRNSFLEWLYWRAIAPEWRAAVRAGSLTRLWQSIGCHPAIWGWFFRDAIRELIFSKAATK